MNILHTKVYFTVHKQTKLWVKEVERERATWYLGSTKSWFTKSYLIFFSLPAFKGWKDSKSSSQQPAGACYPIQPQPHTVILPKWIPNEMVYFRHKVPLGLSKCLYVQNDKLDYLKKTSPNYFLFLASMNTKKVWKAELNTKRPFYYDSFR